MKEYQKRIAKGGDSGTYRVLPPDVFDALEMSAEAYAGIGSGAWWDGDGIPCCIIGHAVKLIGSDDCRADRPSSALLAAGIDEVTNDNALAGAPARVTFAEWCRRLNVIRGDQPTFAPENFPTPATTAKRQ